MTKQSILFSIDMIVLAIASAISLMVFRFPINLPFIAVFGWWYSNYTYNLDKSGM